MFFPKIEVVAGPAPTEPVRAVAEQYEAHPYPKRPWFLRPSRPRAHPLAYEFGQYLRTGRYHEHDAKTRILVAGSGTVEALVVVAAHPLARVTAVDLSASALSKLRLPAFLWGLASRLRLVQADLHHDLTRELGHFDYIVCTGVLHHSPDPDRMLASIAALLKQNGVLRMMIYPRHSRGWVYELQRFFSWNGLSARTPDLKDRCDRIISAIAPEHPLRTSFENYSDSSHLAGLIDGFFHACDAPPNLRKLRASCERLNLTLLGFGHPWHSQPNAFATALTNKNAPRIAREHYAALDAWERLALLDDAWELTTNPVLWLSSRVEPVVRGTPSRTVLNPTLRDVGGLFAAPLAPTIRDELVAEADITHIPRWSSGSVPIRFIEGGLCLGCDGVLPPGLHANRVPSEAVSTSPRTADFAQKIAAPSAKSWARLLDSLPTNEMSISTRTNPVFRSNAEHGSILVPSPIRHRMVEDFLSLLSALGAFEMDTDALIALFSALSSILEPRADQDNRVIPWLSSGDLLRDLLKRFPKEPTTVLAILAHFPAPPYTEQWMGALGRENAAATLARLSIDGATKWFVEINFSRKPLSR